MKRVGCLIFLVILNNSFAAELQDVSILEINKGKDSIELKFQVNDSSSNTFFYVGIKEKKTQIHFFNYTLSSKSLNMT